MVHADIIVPRGGENEVAIDLIVNHVQVCQFHHHLMQTFVVRKCFSWLYSSSSLALNFFWQKNIGAKAALKLLMKLTTGLSRLLNKGN